MELKHLEYIVAVAQEKNISRAAEKLYVTQPTLSHYILKVEESLGVSLFSRTKNIMIPTYAGELYVNASKELLRIIKNTDNAMEDVICLKKGRIKLGISESRGLGIIPFVYREFNQKYPGINIDLIQSKAKNLETLTMQGYVDISLFSLYNQKTELDYEFLYKEELLLAVPKSHRLAHLAYNTQGGKRPKIDISLFKDDTFVMLKPENKLRQATDTIFEDAGIIPKISLESESINSIYKIVDNSDSLTIIPETLLINTDTKNIVYFSINPEKYCWDVVIAYRKDTYLNRATVDFISMLKSLFNTQGS